MCVRLSLAYYCKELSPAPSRHSTDLFPWQTTSSRKSSASALYPSWGKVGYVLAEYTLESVRLDRPGGTKQGWGWQELCSGAELGRGWEKKWALFSAVGLPQWMETAPFPRESLGWLVVKGDVSPDSWMAHCFLFFLAGALHLPDTFLGASSPHLFKLPSNSSSSLH